MGGGNDQIYFGTSAAGLNSSQLSKIRFINPAGLPAGLYYAQILSTGEIVPAGVVPEPGTIAAGIGLVSFFAWRERKRLQAWMHAVKGRNPV